MRKLTLALLLTMMGSGLSAQISIDHTAFPPVDTEYVVQTFDATSHVPAATVGGNAFWDYSTLNLPVIDLDTMPYLDPTGLAGAGSFPNATHAVPTSLPFNIGVTFEIFLTQFWSISPTTVEVQGFNTPFADYSGLGLPVTIASQNQVFTPADTLYNLPLDMGNTFVSGSMRQTVNGTFFGIYPIKVERSYTRHYLADDWGNLLLSATDTLPVLRVISYVSTNDTAFIDSTGQWEVVTSIPPIETRDTVYSYFSPVYGEILRITRSLQDDGQTPTNFGIGWYRLGLPEAEPVGTREPAAAVRFSIQPNPATGVAYLNWPAGQSPAVVEVLSATGQILTDVYQNTQTLNISHLPTGLYFVRATFANGSQHTERLVVR